MRTSHGSKPARRLRVGPSRGRLILASVFILAGALAPASHAQIQINEIRVDQTGTDNDEFFELEGPPSASLAGYTLLVIGDAAGTSCGTIEAVIDLTPHSIAADGFFAGSEATFTLGGIDHVFTGANALNFENTDNVTYVLVTGFSGALNGDIDANDDGVIDATPWTAVVDAVGLIGGAAVNCAGGVEYVYTTTTVGPDAGVQPFHVFRSSATQLWQIGGQGAGSTDTPGAENLACSGPLPDIRDEFREPCVPGLNEAATATVKVRLATSANLHWRVNGGGETVTAMTVDHTDGDTTWFESTIPGQPNNGDRVEYHAEVFNADCSDRGFNQGYFVGTTPIGALRVNDVNGSNVYRFYGARVRGNVTVPPGVFSSADMDIYVQDATGGINVFQFGPHPEQPQLGDDITAASSLVQFNGKLEIAPGGPCDLLDIQIHGPGQPPAPIPVSACTPPESYEGMLVEMSNVLLVTGGDATWVGNKSYRGTNCTTYDSATVFIDIDTNIDGTPIAGDIVDVVGIGSQFDFNTPFTSFYEVIPRGLADITYLDPLGVGEGPAVTGLWLGPSAPNPIGATATLRYRIPGTREGAVRVRLQVVDVQGRAVATLFDGAQSPGEHAITLDRGALGGAAGAVHFLRLEAGGQSVTRKLVYR
jgi:hypothetical protein